MNTYTATVTEVMEVVITAQSEEDAELAIAGANYTVMSTDVTHTDLQEDK